MSYKLKTLEERLEMIKLLESGKSAGYVHMHCGVDAIMLEYYKRRYDKYGIDGLKKTHASVSASRSAFARLPPGTPE